MTEKAPPAAPSGLENPLLAPWNTPFGLPPFDRIAAAHFAPAFAQAMAAHRAEIAAIAADPAAPSFANTVEALERAGAPLRRVAALFFNLVSSAASPALQAVEREVAPLLARHRAEVTLDQGVFHRVAALHARRDALDLAPDGARLLDRLHTALLRAGAGLDAAGRARIAALST
ncbi:MAG: peptidase M3, partial [Acetobacteraceae bacterium]|nr:peptidase M3 [Acetobacteraceae bacterium]